MPWFSPVRKVAFQVENTRVGQITDYDKLSLDIETNGVISPEDAVALAARILQDQLQLFINFEEPSTRAEEILPSEPSFNKNLLRKVDELELSVRSATASRTTTSSISATSCRRASKRCCAPPISGASP